MRRGGLAVGLPVLLVLLAGCWGVGPSDDVVVFAAASLRDVCEDLRPVVREATGREPVYNFAGSNVLARQIEAAPAADVFLSAHERWMDALQDAGRLVPDTRRVFASNRLVLVVHRDSDLFRADPADPADPRELASPAVRFVSLGDPAAVPAGLYAKQYLETVEPASGATLWAAVADRVAPAPDVRAALGLVEARTDVVGIVYATDVRGSDPVRIVYEVPPEAAPPIHYVAAAVAGGPSGAETASGFLDVLDSPAGRRVLERHGFLLPETR